MTDVNIFTTGSRDWTKAFYSGVFPFYCYYRSRKQNWFEAIAKSRYNRFKWEMTGLKRLGITCTRGGKAGKSSWIVRILEVGGMNSD